MDKFTVHAGHTLGGGASGSGFEESAVARQFCPVLIDALRKVGATVTDCTDNVSTTQSANLTRLINLCNAVNRDLDISLHFNSSDDPAATGVEVLYYDQRALAAKVSDAISKASGLRDRGPKERKDLAVLNGTKAPAILIELAFISNASDMKKFFDNMQAIANAIVQAVTGKAVNVDPPAPKRTATIITTGGLGQDAAKQAVDMMFAKGWYGTLTFQTDGIAVLKTGGLSGDKLQAAREYFAWRGWWYQEEVIEY
ncbi:N-acetylmuramoyl-L-alanine amidase [Bacillus phage PBC1]|uniref:N-acetylmuramoyl-L-alanine amidase n=1 Tax=Bacillus phage PBC1 TaxID=1161901 RepID=I1TLF9_9CAUD|nr:endolysin [Bacillus phage PBC1]AFE86261.1 N-acetylmuramoyl-L-alanine amidase [Bacillus phage PBC1]